MKKETSGGLKTINVSEYDNIKNQTGRFGELHQRIDATYQRRSENREAWAAWEKACNDFHACESPMHFVESVDGRKKLRENDPASVERAIAFLELDPYVYRSGYAKAAIIRCIKNLAFSHSQIQRLQGVLLRVIEKFDRQELRAYCRLAAVVDSPVFDSQIRHRLEFADSGIRRRARCVLDYLDDWRPSRSNS